MAGPVSSGTASAANGKLVDTSRLGTADNLKKAGQRFESIFVNMMLSSMRKAKLTDGDLFDSQAINQFRDMQDQQIAQSMASTTPLGIGKAMTDFLSRAQPTLVDSAPDSAPASGIADAAASGADPGTID